MTANAVIPFALNVQKWVHEHNEGPDGKPKTHFTRIPLWWLGILGMIGGEFFNMLAYGWAPTAIVAPVGAVGVFFNGIIATFGPAKEPFTRWHAAGLASIAGGAANGQPGKAELSANQEPPLFPSKSITKSITK